MDGRISSSSRLHYVYQRISKAVSLAILEWLLMFMLFVDASFSYLVTKFARICGLQIPCLLCSRLDHVIGKEEKGFYWDLICDNHKLEISSRVFCRAHNKLVDVQEMCENCLFSFATVNKSNAETYRLLVGKIGADPPSGFDQDFSMRICSCCHKQWSSNGSTQNQLRTTSFESGIDAVEYKEPLPVIPEHPMHEIKKTIDKSSMSRRTRSRNIQCDPLSHVEYSKVKITSESESNDDRAGALIHETENFKGSVTIRCVADDISTNFILHPASPSKPPSEVLGTQQDAINPSGSVISTSVDHELTELNRQHVDHKVNEFTISDLISFADVPSSNVAKLDTSAPEDLISLYEVPSSSITSDRVKVSGEPSYGPETDKTDEINATESAFTAKVESEPPTEIETRLIDSFVVPDTGSFMPSYLDLGDAYKLAVGTTRRQMSGKLLEQISMKDSAKLSEDLKMLLSQMSAARGLELPSYDISPRISGNIDDMKTTDSSLATGIHFLQRRISLERNESGLSVDGSIVSEIEGEGVVDRLKRQVEHDRKLLGALYKELEEERNASAVATNQAMAMITRLQEEKSALHMEALQCLRMMEEQAEYDVEALQKANDLIAYKEKEIKDLEAALELYKEDIGNESLVDLAHDTDIKIGDLGMENSQSTCIETDLISNNNSSKPQILLLGLEDERLYILRDLEKMQKKLELLSSNEVDIDMGNGENSAEQGNTGNDEPSLKEGCILDNENLQRLDKEISDSNTCKQPVAMVCGEADLAALRNAFSELSVRLEELAADQNFLENSIHVLKNGTEGLKFIQDIALKLQELHKIGLGRVQQQFS